MTLANVFYIAYVIKFDTQMMTEFRIPLCRVTDSLSLFDFLTKAFSTTRGKLKIDLKTVQYSKYDKKKAPGR